MFVCVRCTLRRVALKKTQSQSGAYVAILWVPQDLILVT